MTKEIREFDIKLGNCGTSKFFSVTVDNDCIVIKGKKPRKVVLKFLKNLILVIWMMMIKNRKVVVY